MEDNYRWIKVNFYGNGEVISVRQSEDDRGIFLDADGHVYSIDELDFTQIPETSSFMTDFNERMRKSEEEHERTQKQLHAMLANIDAKGIADHQAEIDERAYWRKLRGDIALEIIRQRGANPHYKEVDNYDFISSATEVVFNELYDQDKNFFANKN